MFYCHVFKTTVCLENFCVYLLICKYACTAVCLLILSHFVLSGLYSLYIGFFSIIFPMFFFLILVDLFVFPKTFA